MYCNKLSILLGNLRWSRGIIRVRLYSLINTFVARALPATMGRYSFSCLITCILQCTLKLLNFVGRSGVLGNYQLGLIRVKKTGTTLLSHLHSLLRQCFFYFLLLLRLLILSLISIAIPLLSCYNWDS